MTLLAFGYMARTGKDTAAMYLHKEHGFNKLAFADPLKKAVSIIYRLNHEQLHGELKDKIDPFWNESPRQILQKVGTDGLRNGHRQDVWTKAAERTIMNRPHENWVISDVRFPDEAEMVHRLGGKVIMLTGSFNSRKTIESASAAHESENIMSSYNGWDAIIDNNSTLEYLFEQVEILYRKWRV